MIWTIGEDTRVKRWLGASRETIGGAAHSISVDHNGIVWVVSTVGQIWEYTPSMPVSNDQNYP